VYVSVTYSSYDLDKFQTCPKLWDLSRRWEVPETNWSINLHLGAAISVGLASLRQGQAQDVAELAAKQELRKRYVNNDEWSFDGAFKHVVKGMKLGISSDLNLQSIISADQQKYGRCRPDVVGRDLDDGGLVIWDDKTKLRLDSRYEDETLNEYKHSNQLYEYAWEVSLYYGEPVTKVGINLIVLSPDPRVVPYPIRLTQEAIDFWVEGAELDFYDMSEVETGNDYARPRWVSCTTRYNIPGTFTKALCPMHHLCHDLHGDESKAEGYYKKLKRR
jgi:hypothetical protein